MCASQEQYFGDFYAKVRIPVYDRQFIFSPLPFECYWFHLIFFVTYNYYCALFHVRCHSLFPSVFYTIAFPICFCNPSGVSDIPTETHRREGGGIPWFSRLVLGCPLDIFQLPSAYLSSHTKPDLLRDVWWSAWCNLMKEHVLSSKLCGTRTKAYRPIYGPVSCPPFEVLKGVLIRWGPYCRFGDEVLEIRLRCFK